MSRKNADIKLVFRGREVSPSTLDARHSLSVALAYLESVTSVALVETGGDNPPFGLSLVEIKKGSAEFGFARIRRSYDPVDASTQLKSAANRVRVYAAHPTESPRSVRTPLLRLIDGVQQLPKKVSVVVEGRGVRKWSITKTSRQKEAAIMDSADTLRGKVIRAGGKDPRIQLLVGGDIVSLRASVDDVKQAGTLLYQDVEVEVEVSRAMEPPTYPIVQGKVTGPLRIVGAGDSIQTWDRWYEAVGRPWSEIDDIEGELDANRH